jgi:hypothetical protein
MFFFVVPLHATKPTNAAKATTMATIRFMSDLLVIHTEARADLPSVAQFCQSREGRVHILGLKKSCPFSDLIIRLKLHEFEVTDSTDRWWTGRTGRC